MLVRKWPKSTGPEEDSVEKSSKPEQREQRKLGRGARAKMTAVAGKWTGARNEKRAVEVGRKGSGKEREGGRKADEPVRRGSQLLHSAHDKMTRRKEMASTKERKTTASGANRGGGRGEEGRESGSKDGTKVSTPSRKKGRSARTLESCLSHRCDEVGSGGGSAGEEAISTGIGWARLV
jgi:hypothetical protein